MFWCMFPVPDFVGDDSKTKGAFRLMCVSVMRCKPEAAEIEVLGKWARRETLWFAFCFRLCFSLEFCLSSFIFYPSSFSCFVLDSLIFLLLLYIFFFFSFCSLFPHYLYLSLTNLLRFCPFTVILSFLFSYPIFVSPFFRFFFTLLLLSYLVQPRYSAFSN